MKLTSLWPSGSFDDSAEAIFFLSTGRTGTTFLADYVGAYPHFYAVHEPKPRFFNARTQLYLSNAPLDKRWRKLLERGRAKTVNSTWKSGNVYVESSPFLSFFAPVLSRVLPKSKFIFIYRHPGAVVRSGMRRRWYDSHPSDDDRLVPRRESDLYSNWTAMSSFEKICWYWSEYNNYCLECIDLVPAEKLLQVSFEDVFEEGEGLTRIEEFLGLTGNGEVPRPLAGKERTNAQVDGVFPEYYQWTAEQKETLFRYARNTMERLGYSCE